PTCPICPVADFDKKEDVCIGVEAEFTDLSDDDDETGTTSITTWEWDFGDGTVQTFTSSTNPTHIYSAPGVYQVTLTVTNDNQNPGPCSISITKPITIFDGPNADAGVDKTICFEETAVIGGTPTGSGGNGVLTYNWKPSGGLNNRTTSNPSASPAATTEYIVEVQDTAGCIQRDTMNLVVNPKDSAYIADPDYTICFNNTVPVEIVITGGNSSSYTITLSNGNNSVTRNDLPPTGGLINVPFNTGFPNGFNVTITSFTANDPNICAVFNTEATPVIVRRIPDPNFKKDTLKVCEGESGTALIDFQGSGPYAFDISGGGNTDSYDNINSNPYEAALNAATTTTFTISNVRYANDPACPSNKTDQIVLQVLQNPDPGEDGQISICDGTGLLDLKTVLGGNPSPNGTWRDLNGSGALVNGNFDPNRAVEGEYQFEYTVSAGPDCDQLTSIATVDYNEPPKFQDLVEDCSEQLQDYKVRFTAFGGDPDSYTSAGGTFSGTGAFRVFESTADYPTKTSYTISFDDANGCGPVTITGFKNCGCFTNSGTMNTSLKEFCETDVANLTFNDDSVLVTPTNGDPKDTLYFVLHEGSGKSIVNPVDSFQTPSFSFKAGMQYGKTYYLSPVAGRPLPNGSIDYDPQGCVSVGQGAPVKFFREPTITANELQQDVCDGDPVRIALNFTGSAPYNLSMIEQSSGDTLSYTNLGQRDTIQLVPDNSETYNIFKIGDKYCTDVMVMESVNFVLHQPVDSVPGTLVFNCTRDAAFYTVEIQLSGDPASMTVNPSSAGTIDGSTGIFTSAPLANKSNYSFTFSDQYNCGSFTLSGTYECPCITAAGTIVEDTVQVCRNSPISFTKNTSDSVHDPNDDFVFIVYSNPNDPIGSILLEKKTTTFPIEAPLVPDVFYYASMVMGNQNGAGGVNYNDPCLDITPPVVIRWNGLPSADYAGSDQRINLCLGSEFKFPFDLAGNGPFALEYKIDGGSLVYDTLYNQPSDTFRITPADDDSLVFVRVIDGFGCQRAMDDTLVANVLPSPTMSVLNGGDTTVCAGETIEIKLSVNFNQSYSWQLIDTITNTIIEDDRFANEQTLTLSNIVANSNMVLKPINLEDAVCTGVASGTKAVFVTQNPSFTMGTSPDICEGESTKVEVTVSGGVSPFEIDVEGPGGFSQTFPIVSGDSIELPGFVPGVNTYTGVEIRDASSNKQCVGTGNSTSYTVNPLPDLSLVSVTSEVCTGDDIPFVVSTTGSGNDFSIHVTGSSGLDSIYTGLQNGNNDLVFPGSDNGQTVTINVIRVTDELGCTDGFNESGQVTQFDRPVINFSFNNAENCAPLDLEVYPSIQTPANSTCTWTFEDGQVFNSCNAPFFPKIEMVGGIDLNVRVETDQGCFTDTTFVDTVIVQPNPDARFVFDPAIPTNLLHVVSFENRSDLADNSAWFFDTLGMSFDRNPTFEFPVTPNETYDVKLVVSTSFGCTDSITRELTVEPDLTFYIPNSFTPNGDGTNDIFKPVLTLPQESLLEYEFYVFNRWGEQLFYSDQIDEGWDGQFNGKTVSKGGYTYMVKARVITSTETIRKYGMVIVAD
ncbi:MAG: PKD domain-containing protein, partial [Luteibaculum sp.]